MTVIRGMAELQSKLTLLQASADAIAESAADAIAEGIAQEARDNAPVLTGELRDSIGVDDGDVVATADHAGPVEFGTVDTPSQPFMRPAVATAPLHVPEAALEARRNIERVV